MSLYIVVHTWKKEDFNAVGKKVIEALPYLPKGTTFVFSVADARQTGAWCVYDTEKPADVKAFLDKSIPEQKCEILPVIQFYPPGPELYKIIHMLSG